jgi:hypothetical protein
MTIGALGHLTPGCIQLARFCLILRPKRQKNSAEGLVGICPITAVSLR